MDSRLGDISWMSRTQLSLSASTSAGGGLSLMYSAACSQPASDSASTNTRNQPGSRGSLSTRSRSSPTASWSPALRARLRTSSLSLFGMECRRSKTGCTLIRGPGKLGSEAGLWSAVGGEQQEEEAEEEEEEEEEEEVSAGSRMRLDRCCWAEHRQPLVMGHVVGVDVSQAQRGVFGFWAAPLRFVARALGNSNHKINNKNIHNNNSNIHNNNNNNSNIHNNNIHNNNINNKNIHNNNNNNNIHDNKNTHNNIHNNNNQGNNIHNNINIHHNNNIHNMHKQTALFRVSPPGSSYHPSYQQPSYNQPSYHQPSYQAPYHQPSYHQPSYQPSYHHPPYHQPS
ncbi:hypothetical protein CRUP_008414 [Coryphaenoides rupestris]|nr:hypothetical protein CRUP_008414 [Coryphaenoides rupestris]